MTRHIYTSGYSHPLTPTTQPAHYLSRHIKSLGHTESGLLEYGFLAGITTSGKYVGASVDQGSVEAVAGFQAYM